MTVIADKIGEIIRLIQDKKQRSETVIETNGIESLQASISTVKDMLPDDKRTLKSKLDQVFVCISELLHLLNKLKQNRANSSEQTEDMDALEKQIQNQYALLINEFERLIQE